MSADWQVGDYALCIKQGEWRKVFDGVRKITQRPKPGHIYTVRTVSIGDGDGDVWLGLVETGWGLYRHSRFIKVTPPAADEFDTEVIELLNRKPVEA